MARQWWGARARGLVCQALGLALVLSACAAPAWAVDVAHEINPGMAGSALTLLAGATLLLRERFRTR